MKIPVWLVAPDDLVEVVSNKELALMLCKGLQGLIQIPFFFIQKELDLEPNIWRLRYSYDGWPHYESREYQSRDFSDRKEAEDLKEWLEESGYQVSLFEVYEREELVND